VASAETQKKWQNVLPERRHWEENVEAPTSFVGRRAGYCTLAIVIQESTWRCWGSGGRSATAGS
tara:strand:+ start:343 stop:534 length:192 start_codon:yes stop_codon:yes gene_type:complete